MLPYWLMYFVPVFIALFVGRRKQLNLFLWFIVGLVYIILIGFRFEVGGDWLSYIRHYNNVIGISLEYALAIGKDPGHQVLNWYMARWDLDVYGLNVVYGSVFVIGLIKFSREQMNPWVAFSVAIPYMVIVVAMGYTRQSVALGIFMLAITYLNKKKITIYIVLILIAALFHKTAIILLPLGIFLYGKGKTIRILMIFPIVYGAWDLLVADAQDNLIYQYIDKEMQSAGAKIRVAMNLLPSLILLMYRKEWKRDFNDYSFWFWIAIGSIVAMGLVGVASTAVDRVALYFIPIQLVVYARLPYLARNMIAPSVTKMMIVIGYTVVLFVWLNYAAHAEYWLPYQNILFMDLY